MCDTVSNHSTSPIPNALQGDACALPSNLAPVDCVLAANLLCRLPEPTAFLDRCRTLVKPGGVLVLVSPYSWLKGWTDKAKWLGGYYKVGVEGGAAWQLCYG